MESRISGSFVRWMVIGRVFWCGGGRCGFKVVIRGGVSGMCNRILVVGDGICEWNVLSSGCFWFGSVGLI